VGKKRKTKKVATRGEGIEKKPRKGVARFGVGAIEEKPQGGTLGRGTAGTQSGGTRVGPRGKTGGSPGEEPGPTPQGESLEKVGKKGQLGKMISECGEVKPRGWKRNPLTFRKPKGPSEGGFVQGACREGFTQKRIHNEERDGLILPS